MSLESLRVTSIEPTVSTSISTQVKTTVAFSLTKPCCQKIISSGLSRMAGLFRLQVAIFDRRAEMVRDEMAGHDKSEQAGQQPLPMTTGDKIKSGQGKDRSQQQAAEKQTRRPFRRKAFFDRPPEAAEEHGAEQSTRDHCQQE
jgi:hypothetical protein